VTAASAGARAVRGAAIAARALAVIASAAVTGALLGGALHLVAGDRMAPWIIGRASGVCAYLLLVSLVLLGLALSHPWRSRVRRPSSAGRIRAHVTLALFTFAFVVLHVAALATDRYAGVGWWGTLVPMGATYRPAAVTLGVLGAWIAVLAGASALAAGHLPRRLWWPLHKVAASSFVLVWAHGVLAGGDTPALLGLYLGSGALVLVVAVSRYAARTRSDVVAEDPA
jgi:hypothetical protein